MRFKLLFPPQYNVSCDDARVLSLSLSLSLFRARRLRVVVVVVVVYFLTTDALTFLRFFCLRFAPNEHAGTREALIGEEEEEEEEENVSKGKEIVTTTRRREGIIAAAEEKDEEERSRTIDLTRADEEEEEEEEEDEPQPLAWRLLRKAVEKRCDDTRDFGGRGRGRRQNSSSLFATGLLHQKRRRTRERT